MAQDSSTQSSRRKRRTALIMLALLALVAVAAAVASHWILQTSQKRLLRDMEQDMSTQAGNKVALLTVWSGTLKGQVEAFAGLDLLRLFAAEADASKIPAEKLLELAQRPEHDVPPPPEILPETPSDISVDQAEAGGYAGDPDPLDSLAPRLPMMLRQLKEFIEKNSLWGAYLLNANLEAYLAPSDAPRFSEDQRSFLATVLQTRRPVMLPVRRQEGELVMDMAFPVFAPLYVDASGERVVSILVATYNVLPVARAITRTGDDGIFSSGILQTHRQDVQLINPAARSGTLNLPGWRLDGGRLPLSLRDAPTARGGEVRAYTLALPVPGMPWLVMQGVDAAQAEAQYAAFRKNVLIAAGLVTALAGIVLVALWWWLVGRQERAVADQMRRLYLVVNQQKQIMDGVNSALSAGIVLNDLSGVIYYVNQSYARMTGLSVEQLRGLPHSRLPSDLARSLVTHTLAVNQTEGMASFTEALPVEGRTRHFLTACSPFRDDKGRMSGVVSVYSDITELVLAQQRAQHMITQTVAVFVRAIEAVDPYLCGQSTFTAQLSVTLAYCLGLNDAETLATLRTAASLSQIGMIQLPRELLTKTGALSAEERARLQRHVEYARRALTGIDFGLPVLEAISQMYERLDGSGYPEGLKGDQICLNARILAVANTFCALVRPRSYRMAHGMERAMEILNETPRKYDPQVVRALQGFLQTGQGREFFQKLRDEKGGEEDEARSSGREESAQHGTGGIPT